jgi:hypothetical protein
MFQTPHDRAAYYNPIMAEFKPSTRLRGEQLQEAPKFDSVKSVDILRESSVRRDVAAFILRRLHVRV